LLEEIRQENDQLKRDVVVSTCFGADPELDEFMVPPLILFFVLQLSLFRTHTKIFIYFYLIQNKNKMQLLSFD
jgi:hypothetical protein